MQWLWIALAVYMATTIVGQWITLPARFSLVVLMASVAGGIGVAIRHASWHLPDFSRSAQVGCTALTLWIALLYLRSSDEVLSWQNYILQFRYVAWTCMLCLWLPPTALVRSFLKVQAPIWIVGICLLMVSRLTFTDDGRIQFIFEGFTVGAGFIVLTPRFHSRGLVVGAYLALAATLLVATLAARRGMMLTTLFYLMGGAWRLLSGSVIHSKATRLLLALSLTVAMMAGAAFYMVNARGAFRKITDRATDNTREYVFVHFFYDMSRSSADLVFGRSLTGSYYCPNVLGNEDEERDVVECGYLHTLLKGGLLLFVLYVGLMGYAIVCGFRSRNSLLKACAFLMLVQLIDMVHFGLHTYNIKAYMIWMAVALCLSRRWQDMDDGDVDRELNEPRPLLPSGTH